MKACEVKRPSINALPRWLVHGDGGDGEYLLVVNDNEDVLKEKHTNLAPLGRELAAPEPERLLEIPSSSGPEAGRARKEKDGHWRIDGDEVIQVHMNPRSALFTPSDTKCLAPVKELSTKRRVHMTKADGNGKGSLTGTWTNNERAHFLMLEKWAGETIFFREASEVAVSPTEAAKQGDKRSSLRKYMKLGSIWETVIHRIQVSDEYKP